MDAVLLAGGVVGLVVLLGALVGGVGFDFDIDSDAGGLLSIPVLASFLAAFGFAGWAAGASGAPAVVALGVAGLVGVAVGGAAWRISRAAAGMATDPPVRTSDLVGRPARVVTAIPPGALGEVMVHHAGQQLKLSARAVAGPVPYGEPVRVVEVVSSSLVVVEREATFWRTTEELDR